MANYAVGTIKLRGKEENIGRWIKDNVRCCLQYYDQATGKDVNEERPLKWTLDCDGEMRIFDVPGNYPQSPWLWIKDTNRNFIDINSEDENVWNDGKIAYFQFTHKGTEEVTKETECVLSLPFRAAWGVDRENYLKWSEEYDLAIKIYVVESGIGYEDWFECRGGKIANEGGVSPENYMDFVWEVPFSHLGG